MDLGQPGSLLVGSGGTSFPKTRAFDLDGLSSLVRDAEVPLGASAGRPELFRGLRTMSKSGRGMRRVSQSVPSFILHRARPLATASGKQACPKQSDTRWCVRL